jgi:hypothetical protein
MRFVSHQILLVLFVCHCFTIQAQKDCFRIDHTNSKAIEGIEPDIFLNQNDSFFSYCFCYAPSYAHGKYRVLEDSSILLYRTEYWKTSFYKIEFLPQDTLINQKTKYLFLDSNDIPIANSRFVQATYKDTDYFNTDSLGLTITPLEKYRHIGIVDKENNILWFSFDREKLIDQRVIKLYSFSNYVEYKFIIKKEDNGEYSLRDYPDRTFLAKLFHPCDFDPYKTK